MTHHKIPKSRKKPTASKRTRRELVVTSLPDDPVDRLLVTDPVLARSGREIRKYQQQLRGACSEEAWRIYLRIEELTNERLFTFVDRWAEKHPSINGVNHGHLMNLPFASKEAE